MGSDYNYDSDSDEKGTETEITNNYGEEKNSRPRQRRIIRRKAAVERIKTRTLDAQQRQEQAIMINQNDLIHV